MRPERLLAKGSSGRSNKELVLISNFEINEEILYGRIEKIEQRTRVS